MAPAEILHESWNCRCALACSSQRDKVRILRQPASIRVKGQSALNTLVRIVCFAEGAEWIRAFFSVTSPPSRGRCPRRWQ